MQAIPLTAFWAYLPTEKSGERSVDAKPDLQLCDVLKDDTKEKDRPVLNTVLTKDWLYLIAHCPVPETNDKVRAWYNCVELSLLPKHARRLMKALRDEYGESQDNLAYAPMDNKLIFEDGSTPPLALHGFQGVCEQLTILCSEYSAHSKRNRHMYIDLVSPTASQLSMRGVEVRIRVRLYEHYDDEFASNIKNISDCIKESEDDDKEPPCLVVVLTLKTDEARKLCSALEHILRFHKGDGFRYDLERGDGEG